ncbi:MAG: hypothetical protein K8L97_11820 [Anaerolineae bacterium]|nr:hypothetical protein [Anaerolineae bacterium]
MNRRIEYYFHDFRCQIDSINMLDALVPIYPGSTPGTTRFGRVAHHLTVIESRRAYKQISIAN